MISDFFFPWLHSHGVVLVNSKAFARRSFYPLKTWYFFFTLHAPGRVFKSCFFVYTDFRKSGDLFSTSEIFLAPFRTSTNIFAFKWLLFPKHFFQMCSSLPDFQCFKWHLSCFLMITFISDLSTKFAVSDVLVYRFHDFIFRFSSRRYHGALGLMSSFLRRCYRCYYKHLVQIDTL